ncbi:hypothetical protein GCM10009122_22480 [Fulvivirga kasyanovii]
MSAYFVPTGQSELNGYSYKYCIPTGLSLQKGFVINDKDSLMSCKDIIFIEKRKANMCHRKAMP